MTVALLQSFKFLNLIKFRDFDKEEARKWFPIAGALVTMIYTGSKSLQYLRIPIYTIFKNLTIILIAYGEVLWFGGNVTQMMLISFGLMVRMRHWIRQRWWLIWDIVIRFYHHWLQVGLMYQRHFPRLHAWIQLWSVTFGWLPTAFHLPLLSFTCESVSSLPTLRTLILYITTIFCRSPFLSFHHWSLKIGAQKTLNALCKYAFIDNVASD